MRKISAFFFRAPQPPGSNWRPTRLPGTIHSNNFCFFFAFFRRSKSRRAASLLIFSLFHGKNRKAEYRTPSSSATRGTTFRETFRGGMPDLRSDNFQGLASTGSNFHMGRSTFQRSCYSRKVILFQMCYPTVGEYATFWDFSTFVEIIQLSERLFNFRTHYSCVRGWRRSRPRVFSGFSVDFLGFFRGAEPSFRFEKWEVIRNDVRDARFSLCC